jgi:putative hydrolase of the HAD superfamily
MIKAVIFDCFGVLASDGWLPFKRKYFGHDKALFEQASDLNKRSDSGFIKYTEFIDEVAKMAGIDSKEALSQISRNPVDEELFGYIAHDLKPRYKIGMLSNASSNWLSELFTPEQNALFDATALSYDMGVVKPDPKAYQTIADRLGVEMEECVFADDQERYVTAAKDVGMHAVLYKDYSTFKVDLEKILQ